MSSVPGVRIRVANDAAVNGKGEYVLYWMVAFRRTTWNFSLQRARELAHELGKPLLIFEPLRSDYRWASDRLHQFVIQGMAQNARRLNAKAVFYYPYLETSQGDGKGLLQALAKRACAVISDDYPCFFLPRMMEAASRQIPVHFELVDSNGLLPIRTAEKVFARAYDFRRHLRKNLRPHLDGFPEEDPLDRRRLPRLKSLPQDIMQKWPPADVKQLAAHPERLTEFPVDHDVLPTSLPGGSKAARAQLDSFLQHKIQHYAESRNEPEHEVTSGLSPYLHFGHISAHEVFRRTVDQDGWSTTDISDRSNGSSTGWWGTGVEVESFLDELITWRELGFNMCAAREDYDRYDSLPEWALKTLADHAADGREYAYDLDEFENAQTHDALWNAAQRQLLREGRIHNYVRMLWGKKILHWSPSPQQALETMIELNNKYALDGRDPNSYSGIFWCLGRYDRPWGPERQIFGKVRYMSCDNAARKFRLDEYLRRFADEPQLELPLQE